MQFLILFAVLAALGFLGFFCFKSIFFWIYLWQLKEYRFDRFWAEYGEPNKIFRFWVFSGGRSFKKPIWTIKAVLIFLICLIIVGFLALNTFADLMMILASYVWLYLFIPIIVATVIFIFKIPTYLLKQIVFMRAAIKIRSLERLKVIGITGSYGKSSTKEFLAQILSYKFRVAKTPANINTEIGIAKFVVNSLPLDAQIFIVEMGAYRIGEIKRICRIVKPKIGIITGISEQHLELFGSLENVKSAKYELIESLPKNGFALFSGENQYCLELAQKYKGLGMIYRRNAIALKKNMPAHYELNLSAAIDVAKYLGMTPEEIYKAVEKIDFTDKMINIFNGKKGALVIDDTYSANPDGVLAGLDYLDKQGKKTRVVIMPCLIELGSAGAEIHRKIGRKISELVDLAIITTPDYFKEIKEEAGGKAVQENNPEKIKIILEKYLNSETAVLLEGRLPGSIIEIIK